MRESHAGAGEAGRGRRGSEREGGLSPIAEKPMNLPRIGRDGDLLKPITNSIVERRATLHFAPDPVADEYLEAILALGAQAPSGFNLQPWRFLVLRSPERRQLLRRVMPEQPGIAEAPVVIVTLGVRNSEKHIESVLREGLRRSLGVPGEIHDHSRQVLEALSTVPTDVWVNRNTMVAVAFMMLAAEAYGFNTLAVECFDPRALREELGVPNDLEVVALLGIGRRQGEEKSYPGRFALESIVFDEAYGQPWQRNDSRLPAKQQTTGFENE
jgi:nitroreductase